ncbi:hypothetical protein EDEG_00470 [Edhazardia aedis USNM 41457]|uniref:Uncharacterized protein n=1 Tax=Edhazardia aedis (strain USNM 41457) TaxID=1003232 RepID=J9DFG7_EDHAE|nr:hypothetical protein EDEG_00470 [Edhazardia aedis USNM 41457]|eukprot:EJW01345.1 hypothetical protein EDEG_00470 [Edhazardia aedis USNM 41457]
MHNTYNRFQQHLSVLFNLTVLYLFLNGCIYHLLQRKQPVADNIVVRQLSSSYNGFSFRFVPNVDFTEDFKNAGLKQVFVYLKVRSGGLQEEMAWSLIMRRDTKNKKLNETLATTYNMIHRPAPGDMLLVELRANYFPYIGIIEDKKLGDVLLTYGQ